MSVASTCPVGATRRAAARLWPPAPAATSSTRAAGGDAGRVEHPLRGRAEPVLDGRAPPVPCLGGVLPLLARGGLVRGRVERGGHGAPPSDSVTPGTGQNRSGTRQNAPGTSSRLAACARMRWCRAFVGRGEALAILAAALTARGVRAGGPARRPGLVLVSGEAGIGKTALLTRFAADLPRAARTGAPAGTPGRRRRSGRGPRRCRRLWEARADLRADAAAASSASSSPSWPAGRTCPAMPGRACSTRSAGCSAGPPAADTRPWSSSMTCIGPTSPRWTCCGS